MRAKLPELTRKHRRLIEFQKQALEGRAEARQLTTCNEPNQANIKETSLRMISEQIASNEKLVRAIQMENQQLRMYQRILQDDSADLETTISPHSMLKARENCSIF